MAALNLYIPSANGKQQQGPAALTNNNQENIDQIFSGENFPKVGYLKNLKPAATPFFRPTSIYSCQHNSNPSRDAVHLNVSKNGSLF
jgi:hypothetical protein